MKNFIKSLKLRRSDLLLLIGFIPFTIFMIFGQLFMQFQNPSDVALPLWAAIACFVVMVGCWGYYLYLEVYLHKEKYNLYLAAAFLFLMLLNIIVILIQPKQISENVIIRYREKEPELIGTTTQALIYVSDFHKFIFVSEFVAAIMLIYIGLFVFPKRFKSLSFIKYLGYALFIFLFVLIIYGYIVDFNKYVAFFKHILNINRTDPDIYHKTVVSFILHRNAYGMVMMLGIVFAFINHSIEKKWYYYLLVAFFFINMLFSLCKTGIVISVFIIAIYVFYRLFVTYKENKRRNLILIITFLTLGLGLGLTLGLSFITKGKIFGSIYSALNGLAGGGQTLDFRAYIWDNSFQLIRNGYWLIGRGFGTFNLMLEPMNVASHGEKVFPSHSSYLGLLAEGGILFLLAYLALLVYAGYVIVKCYKKNPGLTLAMSLGVVAFILYSFIETIHYFVYIFLFPIMVLYHTEYHKEEN